MAKKKRAKKKAAPKKKVAKTRKRAKDPRATGMSIGEKSKALANRTFACAMTLVKNANNKPGEPAMRQLHSIAEESIRRNPGWSFKVALPAPKREYKSSRKFQWIATGKILIELQLGVNDTLPQVIIRAKRVIGDAIKFADAKGRKWKVERATLPGNREIDLDEAKNSQLLMSKIETAYIILPDDWHPYFDADIYGLDRQIRLAWDAMTSFTRSEYRKRSHVCFHGQPGCGKTTVGERFIEMVEELSPDGAVRRFTASQTSKAGLENILIEANPKPSFIVIEEIDKADEMNMSCLLDVCNTEGSIKKANANINVNIPLNALVFCTVNNVPKFKRALSGALASRFAHKIFFPRPSWDVMELIGKRDIREFGGQMQWVHRAIRMMKEESTNDPRRLCALLDGGARLMDGSFAKDIKEMREALIKESDELRKADESRQKYHASVDLTDA